jgi:hypothetical protein
LRITEQRFINKGTNRAAIRALGAAVKSNSASTVFRAQLVVPEQRQLFDYWTERSGGRAMPSRKDINPAHIPRVLSGISLVDVCPEKASCRIRLAGTRLREIYDREITGLYIEDLDWGDKHDYWIAAYRRTIQEASPPRRHSQATHPQGNIWCNTG